MHEAKGVQKKDQIATASLLGLFDGFFEIREWNRRKNVSKTALCAV
tara:strand:- start:3478 stop:3615 length:138 start_codon:yes stop_codon:yes gene_type:complete